VAAAGFRQSHVDELGVASRVDPVDCTFHQISLLPSKTPEVDCGIPGC
jgi:hypothetical protein